MVSCRLLLASIRLCARSGAICTPALLFNVEGQLTCWIASLHLWFPIFGQVPFSTLRLDEYRNCCVWLKAVAAR